MIGAWLGIVTDTLALAFLGEPIRRHARHSAENQFVGLVCDALRSGKKTIPRLPDGGVYRPGTGLLFDLVFGTVSTLVIYMVIREEMGADWGVVAGRPFFAASLAAFVLCQIGLAAWQIAGRRGMESEIPVKVSVEQGRRTDPRSRHTRVFLPGGLAVTRRTGVTIEAAARTTVATRRVVSLAHGSR